MFAIAELTMRKLKEPAFLIMLFFSGLLGACFSESGALSQEMSGGIMAQLFSGELGHPVLTSSAFAVVISGMIAIFIGATDIPRDIDTGMILFLLTKPLRKRDYLIGKFLGVLGICLIFFFTAQVAMFATHFMSRGEMYALGLIARQLMLCVMLIPLVALTVTTSCFLPDFSAMIISAIYIVFAVSCSVVPVLVGMLPKKVAISFYLLVFYYMFPNFIYFFQSFRMIGVVSFSLVLYSLSIMVIFLSIGVFRMENRDLA